MVPVWASSRDDGCTSACIVRKQLVPDPRRQRCVPRRRGADWPTVGRGRKTSPLLGACDDESPRCRVGHVSASFVVGERDQLDARVRVPSRRRCRRCEDIFDPVQPRRLLPLLLLHGRHRKPSDADCSLEIFFGTARLVFYSARNARIASAVLATAIPSVRLSVRPVLCQNDGT